MWLHKHPPLFLALLITGVLVACKAPTAPQSGPTLTLILPDSARVFDTVQLRAHYSDSLKRGWEFEWQFGDSSHGLSADTSIAHMYDSAGTYNTQVILVDSVGKTIAKQGEQLQILPNHFDLMLLKEFHSVTIECYGFYEAAWFGQNDCVYYSDSTKVSGSMLASFANLVWTDSGTVQNTSDTNIVYDTSTMPSSTIYNAWRSNFRCQLDPAFTMIQACGGEEFNRSWDTHFMLTGNGSDVEFGLQNAFFKRSSDSDFVFEVSERSDAGAENHWWNQPYPRCIEWQEGYGKIDFSNVSVPRKIVIRFHN
jgi:hypothetical protein